MTPGEELADQLLGDRARWPSPGAPLTRRRNLGAFLFGGVPVKAAERVDSGRRSSLLAWQESGCNSQGVPTHKPFLEIAPCLIVVLRLDYEPERLADGTAHSHKNYYVQESVGIAVGMLLTALHTAGLATLTHTPSPMGFLAEILGRPKHERPYLLIPVGFPARHARVPEIERKSLAEVRLLV